MTAATALLPSGVNAAGAKGTAAKAGTDNPDAATGFASVIAGLAGPADAQPATPDEASQITARQQANSPATSFAPQNPLFAASGATATTTASKTTKTKTARDAADAAAPGALQTPIAGPTPAPAIAGPATVVASTVAGRDGAPAAAALGPAGVGVPAAGTPSAVAAVQPARAAQAAGSGPTQAAAQTAPEAVEPGTATGIKTVTVKAAAPSIPASTPATPAQDITRHAEKPSAAPAAIGAGPQGAVGSFAPRPARGQQSAPAASAPSTAAAGSNAGSSADAPRIAAAVLPAPVTPVTAPASVAQASVASPAAAVPTPPQPPSAFAAQVSQPVFALATSGNGTHTITVSVSPENLGPVTVRAHVSGAGMRIELFSPSDGGRDALKQLMPDLRNDLASAGVDASLDLSSQGQPGTQAGDSGRERAAAAYRNRPAAADGTLAAPVLAAGPSAIGSTSILDILV